MRFRQFVILAVLSIAEVFAAPASEVIYQGNLSPRNIAPTFDNGYLIVYEGDRSLSVFGQDGLRRYQVTVQQTVPKSFYLLGAAADTDGTVAANFFDNWNSQNFGFVVLDPTGKQLRTVLTGSYSPAQICFAPDHTIWLAGTVFHAEDYMVFRKYSLDGQELGQFIPKSTLGSLTPVSMIWGRMLRASSRGIVALLQSQPINDAAHLEWVELNLEGQLQDRPGQHGNFLPWALAPDGTIYAKESADKLLFWNRSSGVWKPVAVTAKGHLEGADENGLVFQLPNTTTFAWVPIDNH